MSGICLCTVDGDQCACLCEFDHHEHPPETDDDG